MAKDGLDGTGLQLENIGQSFQVISFCTGINHYKLILACSFF